MEKVVLILSLMFLAAGILMRFMARRYKTDLGKSIKTYQIQYWFMPWKTNDILSPVGVKLSITSTACILIGVVCFILVKGLPGIF